MTAPDQAPVSALEAFEVLDLRVGRVVRCEPNAKARKPAYHLWIDFGEALGTKESSAQLTALYTAEALVGRQVVAAVNLGVRVVAGVKSEVLVLGLPDPAGNVVLLAPEREVPLGGRVY
ncbi:MAG TPA: tRNA-binding protein [Gemmatimonadales bacterium]|nr:tRNA-binding protein [Gemmatimonadales bacterium]